MVRLVGSIAILLGSGGLGYCGCQTMKNRLRILEALEQSITLLAGEIQYGNTPLTDCFQKLSQQFKEPLKSFYKEVAQEMDKDSAKSLEQVWQEACNRYLTGWGLKAPELAGVRALGQRLGSATRSQQLDAIAHYEFYLKRQIQDAGLSYENNYRLCLAMGWIAGMFVVLFFI
jgi:stage III sporulation protein AB